MPRGARLKAQDSIYHIMMRSISERDLFNDDQDKYKYFFFIKKYMEKFQFKVYAYCLMDSHGHLMVDANGADISRIMHAINFSYAQYYNRKYQRHGHIFQDRFKSKIVDSEKYCITLSAYIHNNPKDIEKYKDNVIEYPFSSLRDYMYGTNGLEILDKGFLTSMMNLNNKDNKKAYLSFIQKVNSEEDELDVEFQETHCEYRSGRKILPRNASPDEVMKFIENYTKIHQQKIHIKYNKKFTKVRALTCFLMSCFCNISQKSICHVLGNITQSRVSKLSALGQDLVFRDAIYGAIMDEFIKTS